MQPNQLDQDAVNLAKAIRQTESGGNFKAEGKSGEYGAYQFTEPTWNSYSKKHGINVPLRQSTLEQQNEVAYKQVKEWKDKGYNPGQIASMWNAGEGEPEAYTGKFSSGKLSGGDNAINEKGVRYDVPSYAKSVATEYHKIKSGGNSPAIPNQSTVQQSNPEEKSLGTQLGSRLTDASKAISDSASGKINPISGVIQTAGAIAGGVGDVINKGLELIPGVKQLEAAIGYGVGSLAKTEVGQSVVKSLGEWSKKHPELSSDIGAGINIITAIPILRGIGAIKNVAMDSVATALKGIAEKGAIKDLTEVAARTVGGRNAIKEAPDAIRSIINERALPDIENGRYATQSSFDNLSSAISDIEEKELQAALAKANPSARDLHWTEDTGLPSLEDLRKYTIEDARTELSGTGNLDSAVKRIDAVFKENESLYGNHPTLQQINDMKRKVRKGVNFSSPQADHDVNNIVGKSFQTAIEQGANRLGLGDVAAINKKMASLIKAQKLLKFIDGKPVKIGMTRGLIKEGVKDASTIAGEIAGNATGIPLAGTLAGRGTGGLLSRVVGEVSPKRSLIKGVLDRTGKNGIKTPLKSTAKKTAGLITAGSVNKMQNQ